MPVSHLLELEGVRLLLDCLVKLSALTTFASMLLDTDSSDARELIRTVPYYRSPLPK